MVLLLTVPQLLDDSMDHSVYVTFSNIARILSFNSLGILSHLGLAVSLVWFCQGHACFILIFHVLVYRVAFSDISLPLSPFVLFLALCLCACIYFLFTCTNTRLRKEVTRLSWPVSGKGDA